MERPQSHTTDDLGELQMRAIFAAVGWGVNSITRDYGIDFDVQVFENHQPTGEWFKVQLKSSESTNYSAQGDFISETLSTEHIAHYSTEIKDPIFVIHADVVSKRTFWCSPQLEAAITNDDPRATITIRISTRNELPNSLTQMILILRRIQIKIGARVVSESQASDFAKAVGDDPEKLVKQFQEKLDVLKLQQIHQLTDKRCFAEANNLVERIIASPDSSVESKFSAVLAKERTELMASVGSPQITMPEIHLQTSKRLQKVTKHGPPALKLFSLIARKAGELDVLTFQGFGLHMNFVGHLQAGDPVIALQLATELLRSTHDIVKKYEECIRLARYASSSENRWAVPLALLRVVESVVMFIARLRLDGQVDAAKDYTESAMQLCRMAVWIAERNQDDEVLSYTTTTVMLLAHRNDKRDELWNYARETLAKIKDQQQRQVTEDALDRAVRRAAGERVEGDPEPDLLRQIVENRATGLGLDMTNPEDPIGKMVRSGIKDTSPERVIKHCEHAFVSIGSKCSISTATLANLLQLPSMRSKIIHCDLHEYAVEGGTLDETFALFKGQYCDACKDISPRPTDWKYSDEWQQIENKRHQIFLENFHAKNGT